MSAKTAKIFSFLMLMFLALYVGTGKTFEHHDYMVTGFFIAFFALMGILPEGRSQKNDQGMGEESFRDFIALASGKLGSLEVARTCNVSIPTVARWALGTSSPGELAEPVIRKALEKKLAPLPQDKQIAVTDEILTKYESGEMDAAGTIEGGSNDQ